MKKIFTVALLLLSNSMVYARTDFERSLDQTRNCPDFVVLNYAYGSEKETWTEEMVLKFNEREDIKVSNKCVRINTHAHLKSSDPQKKYGAAGSGTVMKRAFEEPGLKIHLLSPASSLYIRLYEELEKDSASGKLFGIDAPLVTSPIVIAMWEDMARALGWDPNIENSELISWKKIVSLANSAQGWNSVGQNWGNFKFGHTSPHKSNSGLMSLVAEFMAAHSIVTGQSTEHLTVSDVSNPEVINYVESLEKSMVRYGESTGFFGKDMLNQGPNFIHAAVLYENVVIEYSKKAEQAWGKKIVAIYPEEGTFLSDHPLVVVNKYVNAEEKEAADLFYNFLLQPEQQAVAMNTGFRPANLQMVGANQLDSAIFADDIGIIRDLEENEIPFFSSPKGDVINFLLANLWQEVKKPSRTAIVIDVSGSMEGSKLYNAKNGASEIVGGLTSRDSIKLIPFSSDVYLDNYVETAADKKGISKLKGWIDELEVIGGTAYLDAVSEAYDYLCNASPQSQNRAVGSSSKSGIGEFFSSLWGNSSSTNTEGFDLESSEDIKAPAESKEAIKSIILLTDGQDGSSSSTNSFGGYPTRQLVEKLAFDSGKSCNVFVYTIYYEANSQQIIDSLKELSGATGLTEEGTEKNIKKVLEKLSAFGG